MSKTRNPALEELTLEQLFAGKEAHKAAKKAYKREIKKRIQQRQSLKQLSAHSLLAPSRDKSQPSAERVQQLLTYILNSNLDDAMDLVKKNPVLLSAKGSVGEHQDVTALQLAWQLRDAGMCKMLLDNGNGQIHVTLPEQPKPKIPLDAFDSVAAAIAKCDEKTVKAELDRYNNPERYQETSLGQAMDAFRNVCNQCGETTLQDVLNAFDVYAQNWDRFTWGQCVLFFRQVIGYVERLEPVWFKQALVQGIENLLNPNVDLQRVSECAVNDARYSLVAPRSGSGFGFDFACDNWVEGKSSSTCFLQSFGAESFFDKFCRATGSKFEELRARLQPEVAERPTV